MVRLFVLYGVTFFLDKCHRRIHVDCGSETPLIIHVLYILFQCLERMLSCLEQLNEHADISDINIVGKPLRYQWSRSCILCFTSSFFKK